MANRRAVRRYVRIYAAMLQLYPSAFRRRFSGPMAQTFADMLWEQTAENRRCWPLVLWIYSETLAAIMKEHAVEFVSKNKDLMYVGLGAVSLLLVPMVGMLVSDDVAWGPGDFLMAGMLLVGSAVVFRIFTRRANRCMYSYAMGISVGSLLLLIWSNLAVGVIGHAGYGVNLIYFGVAALGIFGMVWVRGQARGMVWIMGCLAFLQTAITAIVLIMGVGKSVGSSPVEVLLVNGLFILMFAASAWLFQLVSKTSLPTG